VTAAAQADFYVATNGSDSWSGTRPDPEPAAAEGPFASVGRARDAVAAARTAGRTGRIVVRLRGGRYYIEPSVVADIVNDTAAGVVYAAYGDEDPVCSSGVDIPGWGRRQHWYLTLYLPPRLA
jgi:hypothetical protein